MKVHTLEMYGPFFIEQIKRRSIWSIDDCGRMIYEKDSQLYWLGGFSDWLQFNLSKEIIKLSHLKIGSSGEYISSIIIPCEFNGNITTLQDSIFQLSQRQINESIDIESDSVNYFSIDIDADDIGNCGNNLETLVSEGDIHLNLDSTSFGNLSIHNSLVNIEIDQLDNLNASNIPAFDSTSTIQFEFDYLFSSDPITGQIQELSDFSGWECDTTSVTEFYLKTTGKTTTWKCMEAETLLFNVNTPTIIPSKHQNFQQFLDSCGEDFFNCKPYIITDTLISDDSDDFQEIQDFYYRNHPDNSPKLLYNLLTNKVHIYYNGLWKLADPECHEITDLLENRIYIVPVTNTIFYLDCDKLPLKIFDKKRLI